MEPVSTERPRVRCLVARVRADGTLASQAQVTTLGAAYLAMKCGYAVVGPDPEDMDALAVLEQERPPFNPPTVKQKGTP